MDRVLPGKSIPWIFSLSDTGISKNRHRNVKRDDLGMFGAKSFRKGTEGLQNLRFDRRVGELIILTLLSEQMKKNVRKLNLKRATAYGNKMRDLRLTLNQYHLHKNLFNTICNRKS